MTIPFSQISPTRRIPLYIAEFSNAPQATVADFVNPSILLGQKTPAASAVAGTRYLISTASEASSLFGAGSPLHLMCRAFLLNHPTARLYAAAQDDATAATAASGTFTFGGTATAAGTIYLYVGGVLVEVGVVVGDTGTTIAAKAETAVDLVTDLPVTSVAATVVLTVTAKVKGTVGNLITIAANALGQAGSQKLPAGVTLTLSAATLASGATNPTATLWGTSLGDEPCDYIGLQFDDATVLADLKTVIAARWNANSAKDGGVYVAKADSKADLLTFYAARNDEHLSVLSYPEAQAWLTPSYEVAAAYTAVAARELAIDPAAPIQMLPLLGVWGNGVNFSDTDRDALAYDGGATAVARNGVVYVEFEGTTYRTDSFASRDNTAEDIQVPAIRSRIRRRIGHATQSAYPRHKLADDDTTISNGQRIVTPAIYAAFLVSQYQDMERDGLVEDVAGFKASLLVERDLTNSNRLNSYISPNLINRARVFAQNIATRS